MTSLIRQCSRQNTHFLFAFSSFLIVAGSITGFLWQTQQSSQAADMSVIGGPSLSATVIDHIFTQVGSPMVGTGTIIERASRATNIDDAFALAVWWAETNDGMAGVGLGDRNPGSVRGNGTYPVAYDGYTIYPSYAAAITEWFNLLHNRYVGRGTATVYSISGPYVGTSSSGSWAYKVATLMARYRNEAPPSAPKAAPETAPTAQPTLQVRSYVPLGKEQNWEQQASEQKPQGQLAKEADTNNQIRQPQHAPIHRAPDTVHISSLPDHFVNQPQLIGGIMLLAVLLAYIGLALRRRRIIIVSTASPWTSSSLLTEPGHTTTEQLAPIPPTPMLIGMREVPPTPILAGGGTIPLTPYIPCHDEAPLYPLPVSNAKTAQPYNMAHPARISRGPGRHTEKLPAAVIGKGSANNTEALKHIQTGKRP